MAELASQGPPSTIDIRLKPAALERWGLPDISYPLTTDDLAAALDNDGDLPFAVMLHLLQQRSAPGGADWQALEPALDRLAELIAPADERAVVSAAGPDWWIEIGPVDLAQPVVTVQRGDELVGALTRREDGRLRLAAYRPLDARSAQHLIAMALPPHTDGTVCMRANNWEYALDCSAGSGQYYAWERGESYLSCWEYGLGQHHDGTCDPRWLPLQHLAPRAPARVACELGVAYAFS